MCSSLRNFTALAFAFCVNEKFQKKFKERRVSTQKPVDISHPLDIFD